MPLEERTGAHGDLRRQLDHEDGWEIGFESGKGPVTLGDRKRALARSTRQRRDDLDL
jgi:hypothetical protein